MKTGLEISIIYVEEHLLELRVSASNGSFAGQAEVYAQVSVALELANILNGFPTRAHDIREFEFGTFDETYAGGGAKLRFYCVDSVGHSFAEVTLRHDSYRLGGAIDSAVFRIPVESSAIDSFVEQLKQMAAVVGHAARLEAVP